MIPQMVLKCYPTLAKLRPDVRYEQVNRTLRVKFRIHRDLIENILECNGIYMGLNYDTVADMHKGIFDDPSKFIVYLNGAYWSASDIQFRDSYVDVLKRSVVFTCAFQIHNFTKKVCKYPEGVKLINTVSIESVFKYISKRKPASRRKPKSMPDVVKKNLRMVTCTSATKN